MEKLEPVLKQKFWILLGVAIIMTFTGWWMATAGMAALISTRTTEIEKSFKDVPTGEIPNESWAKKLNGVNAEQEKSIKITQLGMWKRQEAKMMAWPAGVEPSNGYWGKFSNEKREQFRDSYVDNVIQVWKMVNPMDEEVGTGIVKFSLKDMVNLIGKGPWPYSPPDSDTMWEIQEDLLLLESLFQTITALNGGLEASRTEAIIHEIVKLQLRGGGDKIKSGGSAGGGGGGGGESTMPTGGPPGFGGGGGALPSGFSMPGATTSGDLTSGLTTVSVEFDPTEEFGDDGSSTGGGMSAISSAMANMGASGNGDASTATSNAKPISRYLSPKDPAKPFRIRGFYLSVKMDHTKIPLLIEELSSNDKSVWPIEIVRVQMSRINEDDSSFGGIGGSSGQGRMRYPTGAMPTSMPGSFGSLGGSLNSAGGASQDLLAAFGINTGTTGSVVGTSQQAQTAQAAFENAMKDPVMANVTLCGKFTLYNKVDDLPEPVIAPVAQEPPPAGSAEMENDGKPSDPGDNPSSTPTTTEPVDSTETPSDKTDSPAPKGEAANEPNTEPNPDSKPDSNEK